MAVRSLWVGVVGALGSVALVKERVGPGGVYQRTPRAVYRLTGNLAGFEIRQGAFLDTNRFRDREQLAPEATCSRCARSKSLGKPGWQIALALGT
jgi:hypothetical protein